MAADLTFEIQMNSNGEPVLKGLRRAGEESMSSLERFADRAASGFSKLEARIVSIDSAINLAARAARSIASVFNSVTGASAEAELVQRQLRGTLVSTGQFTEDYVTVLNRQASALQAVTRFGDEEIGGIQRRLIAYGASASQIETLTKSVLDFAEGMGTDAASASDLLGRALQGQTEIFSRYGIKVTEGASAAQKLLEIQKQIDTRYGGQSIAVAETYAGRVKQLKESWGDFLETLGDYLTKAPLVLDALRGAADFVKELSGATTQRAVAMLNSSISALEAQIMSLGKFSLREVLTKPLNELAEKAAPSVRVLLTQLQGLREELVRMKAEVAAGPAKLPPDQKAPVDSEAAQRVKTAADSIEKQIIVLKAQTIAFQQGDTAAQQWLTTQNLIASLGVKVLPPQLAALVEQLKAATEAAKTAKLLSEQIGAGRDALDAGEQADRNGAIEKARADALELIQRIEQLKREQLDIGRDAIDADFGADLTRAIEKSRSAGQAVNQAVSDIRDRLAEIDSLGAIFGSSFDTAEAKIAAIRQAIEQINRLSLNPDIGASALKQASGEIDVLKNKLTDLSSSIATSVGQAAQSVIGLLGNLVNGTIKTAADFGKAATTIVIQLIGKLLEAQVLAGVKDGSGWLTAIIKGAGSFIGGFFHQGGLVPSYHSGGSVAALPRYHDGGDVPIMAQQGEFVVRRGAVNSIGAGNLDQMNRTGNIPGGGEPSPVAVTVNIRGGVVPERPELTKEQIVGVVVENMRNYGIMRQAIVDYGP